MTIHGNPSAKPVNHSDPFLRLRIDKVAHLLDLVGELGLAVSAVTHHPAVLELEDLERDSHRLEVLMREVQDQTSSLGLVPVSELFRRMTRTVRDLSTHSGKPVDFVLEGEEVEVDKVILDQLSDPLVHLLRNAVDHGIQSPEARIASGKTERGRVTLSANQRGREISISVEDDGQGLDRTAILGRARQKGLCGAQEEPNDATVWNYIFLPGFSTATQITNLSGRGVGMDVVQNTIKNLRGRIGIETHPGEGTRISMIIPLTLAFLDCLVLRENDCLYAIPIEVVEEVMAPPDSHLLHSSADGGDLVKWQNSWVNVFRLAHFYNKASTGKSLNGQIMIIANTSHGVVGLPFDHIIGQQQVVLKPLQGLMKQIHGATGYALLAGGEIAIAVNVDHLTQERIG